MSLKGNISFVFLFCVLGKVTLSKCEVVLVNRSRIDRFRVGKGGCTNDTSVCTISATCQSDGSCQCDSSTPTYRNPVIKTDGEIALVYGDSYGCVNNLFIDISFRNGKCFHSCITSVEIYICFYYTIGKWCSGAGCIKKWLKLTIVKWKRHPIRSAYLRVNHYLTTK
jgi:hypothetical protein